MTSAAALETMTLAEFVRRYEQEGPFELIDGEIIPLMPTVLGHNHVSDNLVWVLNQHVRANNLGKTYAEAPYVLVYNSDWVRGARVPDVMFVLRERLEAYQTAEVEWESKPLVLVPDLAVEIVSPNDKYVEVSAKVKRYLQDGVKLVWVIEPEIRQLLIHTQAGVTRISGDSTLTGGDVLPQFEALLKDIFGK